MAVVIDPIRIATRGSALALAQAREVLTLCQAAWPGQAFELRILRTTGDKLQTASLTKPEAGLPKGLFTKELETALVRGAADLAVHSLKDLPTSLPAGLRLGGVLTRADVRDVLVTRADPATPGGSGPEPWPALSEGAVVATSSTRRSAQLRVLRPDLRLIEIRGNVPTRLEKLAADSSMAGTVLAAAGLARLGIRVDSDGLLRCPADLMPARWDGKLLAILLPVGVMVPAVGQAAIGLECRSGDRRIARLCRSIADAETWVCVRAERAFLAGFGGGCHSPVGALARMVRGRLRLEAVAFGASGVWRGSGLGDEKRPAILGRRLGREARAAVRGGG